MDEQKYGCITEQGDLGLGFSVLNESDQEAMKEEEKKKKASGEKKNK